MDHPKKKTEHTEQPDRPGPLVGLRVVDATGYMTGPLAATTLADLGADVIKVEPPSGDNFRGFGHKVKGWSAAWSSINRGKRSIALDLKAESDLFVMKKLLGKADVFLENWRPHVATSLGLSHESLDTVNPRLVHISVTGFGPSGPLSKAPTYDSLIQGHTGMIHLLAHTGAPNVAPYWVVDKVVATFAAQSVLAALYERERTGRGAHLSLPMLDAMSYFNFPDMFQHRTWIEDSTPWRPSFSPVVRTADGYIVVTPVNGGQISRTLKALDRQDIKAEMLTIKNHVEMVDKFYQYLNEILVTQPSAHWLALFEAADVPVAPVRTPEEHLNDAQVQHNKIYREVPSAAGTMRVPRYPATFDGAQIQPGGAPPALNEHGAQIRTELEASE